MPKLGRNYYEQAASLVCKMLERSRNKDKDYNKGIARLVCRLLNAKYKRELEMDANQHRMRRSAKKWQREVEATYASY